MNPDPEGSSIEIGGVLGGVLGSVLGNTLVNPDCGETRASGRRTGESSLGFDARSVLVSPQAAARLTSGLSRDITITPPMLNPYRLPSHHIISDRL
jgi:hypothetical protein